MLSDEEKEIFNNLKDYMQSNIDNGYHKFIYNDLGWDFKCIDCINAIDKVLKQSKEIEELKIQNNKLAQCHFKYEEMTGVDLLLPDKLEYTSNDKIKAKIEELENQKRQWIEDRDNKHKDSEIIYAIEVLQSLLEKE